MAASSPQWAGSPACRQSVTTLCSMAEQAPNFHLVSGKLREMTHFLGGSPRSFSNDPVPLGATRAKGPPRAASRGCNATMVRRNEGICRSIIAQGFPVYHSAPGKNSMVASEGAGAGRFSRPDGADGRSVPGVGRAEPRRRGVITGSCLLSWSSPSSTFARALNAQSPDIHAIHTFDIDRSFWLRLESDRLG